MKKLVFLRVITLAAVIMFILTGCSGSGSSESGLAGVPTGMVATASSSTSIVISWPSVNGALQYFIYSATNASPLREGDRIGITAASSHDTYSYIVTGLNPSQTYRFTVSAFNSHGESSRSSIVSATTFAP